MHVPARVNRVYPATPPLLPFSPLLSPTRQSLSCLSLSTASATQNCLEMELLDFPAELFAQVIHLLVDGVGVCDAFKYRAVCSKFYPPVNPGHEAETNFVTY